MGIMKKLGTIAGSKLVESIGNNLANSKIVGKIGSELSKKQNQQQTDYYCTYTNNNLGRIGKMLENLENETNSLISQIFAMKGTKRFFIETNEFKKIREKTMENLRYLYLARDYFTCLSKNAGGFSLSSEDLLLVTKFAPFFDGTPVMKVRDGNQFFDFDYESYLSRYSEKIENYVIPDINSAVEGFVDAMHAQEGLAPVAEVTAVPISVAPVETEKGSADEMECSECHGKIPSKAIFCPLCGNKNEIKKVEFCPQCSERLSAGAKFCSNCGTKI